MRSPGSQQAADKKPSNTWQMRCVVKVTADSDVLPLSFDLVESLLRSDAVAGEAARTTWPKGHGAPDTYSISSLWEVSDPMEDPIFAPPETVGPLPTETRTVLFGLQVHLNNEVGPVAREFGNALIENLRAELQKAFAARMDDLKKQLAEAETRRQAIRTEFEDMLRRGTFASPQPIQRDPADEAIYKQLQTVVDLSAMTQQTPAAEAFEILRHSVEPPLNLVVIWRDLFDNANVEPTSPVQMDGPASIQLGTALAESARRPHRPSGNQPRILRGLCRQRRCHHRRHSHRPAARRSWKPACTTCRRCCGRATRRRNSRP